MRLGQREASTRRGATTKCLWSSGHAKLCGGYKRGRNINKEIAHEGDRLLHTYGQPYRAKYAGQGRALRQVVSPQVRAYTMRITLQ
jgi:hypothetical protein